MTADEPDDFVLEPQTTSVKAAVVIVAAGNSVRMASEPAASSGGTRVRKPQLLLAGRPILERTCELFNALDEVVEVVLVAHEDDIQTYTRWTLESATFDKVRAIVPGGKQRADSVRAGIFWCGFDVHVIAIHDAARPLCRPEVVRAALELAKRKGAALVAAPVHDTIKDSDDGEHAHRTLDRARLWAAQTPQVFDAVRLRDLAKRAAEEGFAPTDDAALWERYVGPVPLVRSDASNLKITTPIDLEIAAAILRARSESDPT